jgi:NADPH-dependent 2,4-dienoyl-CoA reductase/sulfur reductase-like enzyme
VAASLRTRGIEVTVISQDAVPLEKVLGGEMGSFVQELHEQHGVRFLLNAAPRAILSDRVELDGGKSVEAGMVVLGVGVSPRVALAQAAGLKVDGGVVVDETLRTSAPDVFAAGDVAQFPEAISGEQARIEHWVVAERQGQAAARAMLGIGGAFRQAPFFWSQHYDVPIAYVGYASGWDSCKVQGDLKKQDVCAVYRKKGKIVAIATIGRDRLSLQVEAAFEAGDAAGVEALVQEGS